MPLHLILLIIASFVLSSFNRSFIDFADTMPRFSEISKKSKSRAKKTAGDDKKRKTPLAEDDAIISEPAAPKVPKQKTLTINEPTPQASSLPPLIEGKGKEKVVEPPHPLKKSRYTKNPTPPV